jgi:hypothetical protein
MVKELQDYWSTRPKYEDPDGNSGPGEALPTSGSGSDDGQSYQARERGYRLRKVTKMNLRLLLIHWKRLDPKPLSLNKLSYRHLIEALSRTFASVPSIGRYERPSSMSIPGHHRAWQTLVM